ncbi:MAG: helix-turn-helix transcriptional regulator [Fibrobacteres bacterium]|nr:helix-turn-helix transcriptional regulator [Fibrobacterota bacterium]
MLIVKGYAAVKIDGVEYNASPGDLFLWDPKKLEIFMPIKTNPLNYYSISVNLFSSEGKPISFNSLELPHKIKVKSSLIKQLILKTCDIYRQKGRFRTSECSLLVTKLIIELMSNYANRSKGNDNLNLLKIDPRIIKVLTHLTEHYKESPKLKDLAVIAGVHPVHLIRMFKQATGTTPHNYILDRKIEKSMDYLKLYNDQPSAMNLEFNFHDQAHFYRTFKKRVGMTPTEYIKSRDNLSE